MTYSYDLTYQEHILAAFLVDAQFIKSHVEILKPEYFNDDLLTGIAQTARDFFVDHKDVPSKQALLQEIKINVAPGRQYHEYEEAVERVFDKVGINTEYYRDRAIKFAQGQAIANAIKESTIFLEQGETENIAQTFKDALRVGDGLAQQNIYDYFPNTGARALDYQRSRNGHNSDRIGSGFYMLDELMDGGLGKGELGLVVAPPKHGKTTMLINLAAGAMMKGLRVAYFTLELSKKMIASKFDVRLFGQGLPYLKRKPKTFSDTLKELKKKLTGGLYIVEYPTKGLTVDHMQAVIESMEKCDVVFVDYGQLLKSQHHRGERRHEITDAFEGMRRIAGELRIPIWTAHQGNRPAVGSKIVGMEHVAEDFNIIAISDFAISVNQTEEERRRGKLRIYVMASRIGSSGKTIDCDVDWTTSLIKIAANDEETLA